MAVAAAVGRGGAPQPPDPQSNGIWRSIDKGKTWTFMSNENQRPMYFSQIRVDPNNPDIVYVGGVNPQKSIDGGKTFMPIRGMGHVDNHAIWIDPLHATSKHVMYGNDGGIDVSYDAGATWESLAHAGGGALVPRVGRHAASVLGLHGPAGQRIVVRAELDAHRAASTSGTGSASAAVTASRRQIDPTDPNIFYTESQNGGIQRYDLNTGQTQSVKPNVPQAAGAGGGAAGGGGAGAGAAGGGGGAAGGGGRTGRRRGNVINTPDPDDDRRSSTGTRRSACRRTTRARCSSAAASSSSRATAARPGR